MSGRYRLSSKLLDIGVAGADEYSLAHVAWPEMTALRDATGLTVMLGGLSGDFEGVVLESAESRAGPSPVSVSTSRTARIRWMAAEWTASATASRRARLARAAIRAV